LLSSLILSRSSSRLIGTIAIPKADESGAGNIRIAELIGISAGSIDSVEDCLVDLLEGGLIRITYRRAKDGFEYFDDRIDYSICDPKMLL
jgi:hypothetical protein